MDILDLSVKDLSEALQNKQLSSLEITGAYLDAIRADSADSEPLNVYITVLEEQALTLAREADERIAQGKAHALTGVPIGIKDNMHIKGVPTTCASRILEGYNASFDATVVQRLVREIGMIPLGKLNMDEFAMGSSTETSNFGVTRNPVDKTRIPGGSSGGSAAAVAGKLAPVALGSDTGGSIRQPASLCGVVGFKPTYGRVSRYGLVAFASSLDQIGPLSRTVEDTALIYNVLCGHDAKDSTSLNVDATPVSLTGNIQGLKVGVPEEYFVDGMQSDVESTVRNTIEQLQKAGAKIISVKMPHTEYAVPTYYVVATAEASSNLERYDGVKYGYRARSGSLSEMYAKTRTQGFGDEVKRRIMLGTYVLSAGYYDAYYLKALKVRTLIKQDFEKAFEKVDVLITPTSPTTAFKLGEKMSDPVSMYLSDIFTISANLAGVPAVSVPIGKDSQGLPIGVQLMGKWLDEQTLLNVALAVEQMIR